MEKIISELFNVIEDEVDLAMLCNCTNEEIEDAYKEVSYETEISKSNGSFYESNEVVDCSDICVDNSDDISLDGMEADEYIDAEQDNFDDEDDELIDMVSTMVDEPQ